VKRFKGRRGGRATAVLEQGEARLLAGLVAQVVELLSEGTQTVDRTGQDPLEQLLDFDGPVQAPDDPVLMRLLPDAYRDDEEAAADFRRYTERGLRDAKIAHGRTVIASLLAGGMVEDEPVEDPVEVDLDPDEVQAWLRTLTDVRLALATRLGIEDDEHAWDSDSDEPEAVMHDVYDWLGFVQETLVLAIDA
jgi:hypothetical protein